MKNLCKKV